MIQVNKILLKHLQDSIPNLANKIFILNVPESTPNPVIQFGRIINPDYNHTSVVDKVNVIFNIYTDTYAEGVDITQSIRDILEGFTYSDPELRIRQTLIDTITESYDGIYIQTIKINIK